ncbi:hypothetical protein V8C42DRAFT_75924 [Trichoderma barbatum]
MTTGMAGSSSRATLRSLSPPYAANIPWWCLEAGWGMHNSGRAELELADLQDDSMRLMPQLACVSRVERFVAEQNSVLTARSVVVESECARHARRRSESEAREQGVLAASGAPWPLLLGAGSVLAPGEKGGEGLRGRKMSLRWVQPFFFSLFPLWMLAIVVHFVWLCDFVLLAASSSPAIYHRCSCPKPRVLCSRQRRGCPSPGAGANREREKVRQASLVRPSGEAAVIDLDRIWRQPSWKSCSSNYWDLLYPPACSCSALPPITRPLVNPITSKACAVNSYPRP